jgi:hypothetical protein
MIHIQFSTQLRHYIVVAVAMFRLRRRANCNNKQSNGNGHQEAAVCNLSVFDAGVKSKKRKKKMK